LVTWDHYDGLQSAMIGLINSGISGFTLGHSDIGGYTSVTAVKGTVNYLRTKSLLFRWIEMSTFSDVIMRSHPSNLPDDDFQVYDDDESVLFLKKFTEIHVKLADYKMDLMKEAGEEGTPVTRPLLLHYPDSAAARKVDDQFMLGRNIMMAPVFNKKAAKRDVFLPGNETWVHLWTKKTYIV